LVGREGSPACTFALADAEGNTHRLEDYAGSWLLVVEESRELYVHYGMRRASWWRVWGPATLWAYAKLILRGRRPAKSGGDVSQLGGDVLIDPNGVVALQHVEVGPADRPAVEMILSAIRTRRGKSYRRRHGRRALRSGVRRPGGLLEAGRLKSYNNGWRSGSDGRWSASAGWRKVRTG